MHLAARHLAGLCVAAVLLTGCQHNPVVSERDLTPLIDHRGQARSLSLTTPSVQAAQLMPPGFETWYDTRNDTGPSVFAGYSSATYERSVTYTRDRQSTYNGRVRDRYSETTYRKTYRETTR